jgi:hypothetical protein
MTTNQATESIKAHLGSDQAVTFFANCYYHTLSGYDAEAHRLAAKIIAGYERNLATLDALARAAFGLLSDDDKAIDLAEVQ